MLIPDGLIHHHSGCRDYIQRLPGVSEHLRVVRPLVIFVPGIIFFPPGTNIKRRVVVTGLGMSPVDNTVDLSSACRSEWHQPNRPFRY